MARDAISRQYDVQKNSVKLETTARGGSYQPGTITFVAKGGKSIDIEKIHESLRATRLSGGTRMQVTSLEVTVVGEVIVADDVLLLKVSGTGQSFLLINDPDAGSTEGTTQARSRLWKAVKQGEKLRQVTGRVQGWSGVFPNVLKEVPGETVQEAGKPAGKRMKLIVTDFQAGKE